MWQDDVIKARPEDTKSHNLYIKRPVIVPKQMRGKPKKAPKLAKGFSQHQDIWVSKYGSRFGAKILSLAGDKLKIEYYWEPEDTVYTDTVLKSEAMRTYEIEFN